MSTITFHDETVDQDRVGTITDEGFLDKQRWLLVDVEGISWAVPQGWPNNAAPICQEVEPEGYHAIAEALDASTKTPWRTSADIAQAAHRRAWTHYTA